MRPPEATWADHLAWPFACPQALLQNSSTLNAGALHHTFKHRAMCLGHPDLAGTLAPAWSEHPDPLDYIRHHAHALLRPAGDHCTLRSEHVTPARAILSWRWISLAMPASILAVAATGQAIVTVRLLLLASAPLSPVAHLHQHQGACVDFESVWCDMMSTPHMRGAQRYPPLGLNGPSWRGLLRAAAVVRAQLFHSWFGMPLRAATLQHDQALLTLVDPLRKSMDSLALQMLAQDTLAGIPGSGWHTQEAEAQFLRRGFLTRAKTLERSAFVQLLRVKTLLHRRLVMDPTSVSLTHFVHTFDVMRAYCGRLKGHSPVLHGFENHHLDVQANEVRTGPPDQVSKVLDLVCSHAIDPSNEAPGEWGWTLHFLRGVSGLDGPISSDLQTELRKKVGAFRRRSRAVQLALQTWPQLLAVIRGLDVASAENSGPLFLVAPYLRYLRESSERIAASAGNSHIQPLRVTLHAGEDFRHPLAGLRRVHEPIRWGLLQHCDRIGHGLVLGLDLDKHVHRYPRVIVPLWTRALDLSWAVWAVARFRLNISTGMLRRLRLDLEEVARRLQLPDLTELHRLIGAPDASAWLNLDPVDGMDSPGIVGQFVSRETLRRWRHTIEVDVLAELPLLTALQTAILERLAEMQISVELNPSSNQIIYGMHDPMEQPMYRLNPLANWNDKGVVPITLSTDDPISFATNLSDEYAYAWAGLVAGADQSASAATEWLELVAKSSLRAKFTVAASANLKGELPPPGMSGQRWKH